MKVFIASDHGGFALKEKIKAYLETFHITVDDVGPKTVVEDDDYPDYAFPLAARVANDKSSKGILLCRNGAGVCIAANKIVGIRAALSWNVKHAESTRKDDSTNVLCLPADYISSEDALKIVSVWLNTEFSNEPRHLKRLAKIKSFEENE